MDSQDSRGREVPRRLRVHRRRCGLELRQAAQERQPAIRPAPVRAGPLADFSRCLLQGGRQIHARDRHQIARRIAPLPARLDHDVVAGTVGEARQELGGLRQDPYGTGPWKLTLFAPRERAEMVPNKDYWDKARVPKLDKLVLFRCPSPMPALRRCAPGKWTGSRPRRPTRSPRSSPPASRSSPTPIRTIGPGIYRASKAGPGTSTSGCARPPISRLIAKA